ncbi:MAG: DUF4360 domain-containing protein [Bdellovibrionota bacterium]|nr:MAG: DUF4360 domain-containing protein [Pseudomonadota bacterium]
MKRVLNNAAVLLSGLLFAGAAHAQAGAPTLTFIGSGCPADTESVNHRWEGNTLVIDFADFSAAKGPGVSLVQSRRNCSLTMDLKVPKGFKYTLVSYRAYGHDSLGEGDTRNISVNSFFQGSAAQSSFSNDAAGPKDANFSASSTLPSGEVLWSPCNVQRAQSINTSIRVNGSDRTAPASASIDSLRLRFRVGLCSPEASPATGSIELQPIVD